MLEEMRSISESSRLPFRITETNSIFNEGQLGVSDAFGLPLWGGIGTRGPRPGVLINSPGDAELCRQDGPNGRHVARPLYYGMLMFKEAAGGASMLPVRLAAPGLNMAAYATITADGALKVCLINKDLERGAQVGIEAGRDFSSASLLRLTAPSAEARTEVTFGGAAIDGSGYWSPQPPRIFPWRSDSHVEVPAGSADGCLSPGERQHTCLVSAP
jgi:hypothetical protein